MSRTIINIPVTRAYNPNAVYKVFADILLANGYEQKIIKGEQCWSKGDGVILKQQNFAIIFSNNQITLQGWMGDALTGESSLNGFVAIIPKKKMKKILEQIRANIAGMV